MIGVNTSSFIFCLCRKLFANGHVMIMGSARGTSVQFVEEWAGGETKSKSTSSTSSCVVDARLSLDGSIFEGMYKNVQYGTSGIIAGVFAGTGEWAKSVESNIYAQYVPCTGDEGGGNKQ